MEWRGTALGAEASLRLYHPDPQAARRLVEDCLSEVRRLEAVFSLYRPDSAVSRLNRDGRLDAPPLDLVQLLAKAQRLSEISGGAFDVTVQPLWRLYADHFAQPNADPAGPSRAAIDGARERVGFRHLHIGTDRISFHRQDMAVTLNGIAQGYVTDRVTELLYREGIEVVLVDMGEMRGLGRRPDGRAWDIGIADPAKPGHRTRVLDLNDQAVATSGGYGTRFSPFCHHLFDPFTGGSPREVEAVTVVAATATLADGLSTMLAVSPVDDAARLFRQAEGVQAILDTRMGVRVLI
ncbi:MAG TPA: FAD:protein FMN transferase [Azospirillaceae bacterium]|nr:FAD:protein FMN transferase [Azospirillaceae bacterium]